MLAVNAFLCARKAKPERRLAKMRAKHSPFDICIYKYTAVLFFPQWLTSLKLRLRACFAIFARPSQTPPEEGLLYAALWAHLQNEQGLSEGLLSRLRDREQGYGVGLNK